MSDKNIFRYTNGFNIYGRPGCFTVNFRSPHNALHQISGFKTEDDAQSWVKTRRLVATFFEAEQ